MIDKWSTFQLINRLVDPSELWLMIKPITDKKSVRSFTFKLKELQINDFNQVDKYNKFIRLCDDLNIEIHDNPTTHSCGDEKSILEDFFKCLRLI